MKSQEFSPFIWDQLPGFTGLWVAMEELSADNYVLWLEYAKKQMHNAMTSDARAQLLLKKSVLSIEGAAHFHNVIARWKTSRGIEKTWVTYVTRQNPPVPIAEGGMTRYKDANFENLSLGSINTVVPTFADNIEMFVTVTTATEALVSMHLGIAFTIERAHDRSRGIALPMHAFAARQILLQNPQKRYMMFTPAEDMGRIALAALKGNAYVGTTESFNATRQGITGITDPALLEKIARGAKERTEYKLGPLYTMAKEISDAVSEKIPEASAEDYDAAIINVHKSRKLQVFTRISVDYNAEAVQEKLKEFQRGGFTAYDEEASAWMSDLEDAIIAYEDQGIALPKFAVPYVVQTTVFGIRINAKYKEALYAKEMRSYQEAHTSPPGMIAGMFQLPRGTGAEAVLAAWKNYPPKISEKDGVLVIDPENNPINVDGPLYGWLWDKVFRPVGITVYVLVDLPALAEYRICDVCKKPPARLQCEMCNKAYCDKCTHLH